MLPYQALLFHNELQWVAGNSDEWLSLSPYGIIKLLERWPEFSQQLADSGYCPEDTRALGDFIHGSNEIKQVLRKAQRAEIEEGNARKKPFSFSYSEPLKTAAGKIATQYDKPYWEMMEKQYDKNKKRPDSLKALEKDHADARLRSKLGGTLNILKIVAGLEVPGTEDTGFFESGIEAADCLESLITFNPKILASAGFTELQDFVNLYRDELEKSLETARAAARRELKSGRRKRE